MFARLGAFAYRRRGRVVLAWIVGLVLLGAIAGGVGSGFTSKFGLPNGVESKRGLDLLDKYFHGVGGGQSGSIVFSTTDRSLTDPAVQQESETYLGEVPKVDGVVAVTSPLSDAGAQQI